MCDRFPKIIYRWCRTVQTKSPTVSLIPSFLKNRPIVLTWDNRRQLYISKPIPTPCGRHSAQVLVDGSLYPCDNFSVNSLMFEVPIYINDSSSEENYSRPVKQIDFQLPHRDKSRSYEDICRPALLSISRDSGIQDMNVEIGNVEKKHKMNGEAIQNHFACVDEMLDRMGTPVSFEKDLNVTLNRSQSVGSSLNKMGEQRTSTPIHRSTEKLVIMMPENSENIGKRKYLKKSVEIERNMERSYTTVEKSVSILKNDTEICKGSERVTEFGPDSVDVESFSNVLLIELKDEESQTGDQLECDEKMLTEEDFVKELNENDIVLVVNNVDEIEVPEESANEEIDKKINEIVENLQDLAQDDDEIDKAEDIKEPVDESSLVIEGMTISPLSLEDGIAWNVETGSVASIEEQLEVDRTEKTSKEVFEDEKSLEVMKERVSAHEAHLIKLENDISALDESNQNLHHEKEELLEKKLFLASKLNEDRELLAKEVEELKTQVENQEKANNSLEWEVQALRNRLDSNDPGEVIQLLEEMKVLRDELITLTSKNRDLYGEIIELREENTSLKTRRNGYEGPTVRSSETLATKKGFDEKDESSLSEGTEYRDFSVDSAKNCRSLGVQTYVSALDKEKMRRKVKKKIVKKNRQDRKKDFDSSSGSSTDSLLEQADDVLRKSLEHLLDGDNECAKRHKVSKSVLSSVRRSAADVSISCRSVAKYSAPFIPKSISDLNPGFPIKFIHPLTGTVKQGTVQSGSRSSFDCIEVQLNESLMSRDPCFSCEDNQIISVPMRKVILAWRIVE